MFRRFLRRLGIVIASFIAALVVLELGLRVAAYVSGQRLAEEVISVDPENRPIVTFCGDSNIYGVYVDKSATLPVAVERISRGNASKGVRCINLGVPGHASWDTAEQVRRALLAKPAAIVVTCGVNNLSIRPPEAGFGPIENLKIVKMVRRIIFNYHLKKAMANAKALELGPGGRPIEGKHILLENNHGAVVVTDREGHESTQERRALVSAERDDAKVAERYRADMMEIARLVKETETRLIFATYFAGDEPQFQLFTDIVRSVAQQEDVTVADCAKYLPPAVLGGSGKRAAEMQNYELQNRRSLLLVEDRHPTELGYEVEARVVASALRRAGVLPKNFSDDPIEPVYGVKIPAPEIEWSASDPCVFKIHAAPDDYIMFFIGTAGASSWKDLLLPIDYVAVDAVYKKHKIGEMTANADAAGNAIIKIPAEFLSDLPRPVAAACVAFRGGKGGSARRFMSPPLMMFRKD